MKLVIFGATGRTGGLVVQQAVQAGHTVTAVARRAADIPGAQVVQVDMAQPAQIRAAVDGADAVISTLASGKGNPVCSTLATTLSGVDGLRFVCVAGAAVDAPGDAKALPDRVISRLSRLIAGEVVTDRQKELGILQSSALRWTMLRPPRLVNGPAKGGVRRRLDTPAATSITRADLAAECLAAIDQADLVGQAPFVSN